MTNTTQLYRSLNLIGLIAVIVVNYLANALPIGGKNTGELSDLYPSLFTPTGLTFSIWGLIYLLLALFVFYQFAADAARSTSYIHKIKGWFFVSCLANIGWIFAWHFRMVGVSLAIMIFLLISLIIIYSSLRNSVSSGTTENSLIRPAFSIYLGWITVATIANVSIFLVDSGWNGGMAESTWTIIMLIIACLIGLGVLLSRKDLFYALVLVWAFIGIAIKRNSEAPILPAIVNTAIAMAVVLILAAAWQMFGAKKV